MNKIIENYVKKLRSPKVLIAVGICGILLIFLSTLFSGEEKETKTASNEFSAEEYRAELEEGVEKTVSKITGSKDVSVVITLESGIRYSYADTKEESSSDKTENQAKSSDTELKEGYITVKSADGGEQALLITAQMPEIRGVAIVCEGGDNEILNQKIQSAVMAALDITSKRVYVCGRKQ